MLMNQTNQNLQFISSDQTKNKDVITDWALDKFRRHYGNQQITKDDIWNYIYGVMHAPDWREKYQIDLRRFLPRLPLAQNFNDFVEAGKKLISLHLFYETGPECSLKLIYTGGGVDRLDPRDKLNNPNKESYRIYTKMRFKGDPQKSDTLIINNDWALTNIPDKSHLYQISGRSPLKWAIETLRFKKDNPSDNPNNYPQWEKDSYELVRHLRRLCYLSCQTTKIVESLPTSLSYGVVGDNQTKKVGHVSY